MVPAVDPVLLVTSEAATWAPHRVWGTGGWLPPEAREALDWLTLCRLLGWGVTVIDPAGAPRGLAGARRWLILAEAPGAVGEPLAGALHARLETDPVLVVARAAPAGSPLARLAGASVAAGTVRGRALSWRGPGPARAWSCRHALEGTSLALDPGVRTWATVDGAPLAVARPVGRGAIATLAVHPGAARDREGAATALLRHLLVHGAQGPVAWLDLEGVVVLRMDDPGGAQNVHNRHWAHRKLGEADWQAVGRELSRRDGRLSIGYVAGWVDDGDARRGALEIAGRPVARVPGRVHPSPLVRYRALEGPSAGAVHDYTGEYRGIQALRRAGLGDVELHGFTHMHPDGAAWAAARDRHDDVGWFRELGPRAAGALAACPPGRHPLALGVRALDEHFGVRPTTLICPGDEWTTEALRAALDLGLGLVSSYYLALAHGDRLCWAQHVCAPYLDEPAGAWFDAGLPVIGYFHDRDVAEQGAPWLARCLDGWAAAGARRFVDFRELAAALDRRVSAAFAGGGVAVTIDGTGAPAPVRPLALRVHRPAGSGAVLRVSLDGVETAAVDRAEGAGAMRLLVAPGHCARDPDAGGDAAPSKGPAA